MSFQSVKNLKLGFRLALAFMTILTVVAVFIIIDAIRESKKDSQIINMAGRQRMKVQFVAKSLFIISKKDTSIYDKEVKRKSLEILKNNLSSLNEIQNVLIERKIDSLKGKNSVLVQELFTKSVPEIQFITNQSYLILEQLKENKITQKQLDVEVLEINKKANIFINLMDKLVGQYVLDVENKLKVAEKKVIFIGVIFIICFVIIGFYIFNPLAKKVESKLNEVNILMLKLKAAQKIANVGSWERNLKTNINTFTEQALIILGFPEHYSSPKIEEILLKIHPLDKNEFLEKIREIVENKKDEFRFQYRIILSNNQIKYIDSVTKFLYDENGEYYASFGTIMDVTEKIEKQLLLKEQNEEIFAQSEELKQTNEQLTLVFEEIQEKNEELIRLNKSKDKIFSIIAHDLRSPLASFKGVVDILDPQILSSDDLLMLKESLNKEFDDINIALNNILEWSNSQMKGDTTLQISVFNFNDLVEENINFLQKIASNKHIKIKNKVDSQIFVNADKNQISTIVRNLLSNSLKFTPENGEISVSTSKNDNFLIVEVKDSGMGMTASQVEKIFSHETYTTRGTNNEKGTGLGLKLVREFVEKNGGKIWVTSKEGEGTSFYFTIPLEK
jgi:signal transduction histidine kinase